MKVLFLGSNPSRRSDKTVPFWHDARSSKVLTSWIDRVLPEIDRPDLDFANVVNYTTENNRPLKMAEIKAGLQGLKSLIDDRRPNKIVALGKSAERALTLLGLSFFAAPHPSGLNRKLNDKVFVDEMLTNMKTYLEN